MVICNLSIADDKVMGKHTPDRFMETATDHFIRYFEILERPDIARVEALHRLLIKEDRHGCRVGNEISPCPVAFNGIRPFRDFPFQLHFWKRFSLWQTDLDTVSCGFDIRCINQLCQGCHPHPRQCAAASIQGKVFSGLLPIPAWTS